MLNSSASKQEFIKRVQAALGRPQHRAVDAAELWDSKIETIQKERLERITTGTDTERQHLIKRLKVAAQALNVQVRLEKDVASIAAAIVRLAQDKETEWGNAKRIVAWQHPLIEKLQLEAAIAPFDIAIDYVSQQPKPSHLSRSDRQQIRQRIADAYIGVTSADYCLADTATLVMRVRAGQARAVSLLPSIHVAVIEAKQIISDLKTLLAVLKQEVARGSEGLSNCMTFVTGPSKTGDIEAQMVYGAHGPRELYLFILT